MLDSKCIVGSVENRRFAFHVHDWRQAHELYVPESISAHEVEALSVFGAFAIIQYDNT